MTPENQTAVLIIDLQVGMMDGVKMPAIPGHESLLDNARALIDWARVNKHPLLFVRHDGEAGDILEPGAPGWPLHPALGRRDDEPIISKTVGDAFEENDLADRLRREGVTQLVLAGAQTDECVAATLAGALKSGFKVTVASDAHGTVDWGGETAAQKITRHNALFAEAGAVVAPTATVVE
jgi:nicotinamidase-related amidase